MTTKATAPFNALIVANNTVEAADLKEFLELSHLGPVAETSAVDEALALVQALPHAPGIVVFAVSTLRAMQDEFLALLTAVSAPVIWIDMEPGAQSRAGIVAIRRPYSEVDLRAAITQLAL